MSDKLLAEDMGSFFDDPLGFVLYAFNWDSDQSIQKVKLLEPYASRYNSIYGPDKWVCELFDEISEKVRDNNFEGDPVDTQQYAVSSGHGIGKSCVTSWIILWIMSTRPHCRGVVTANTGDQLSTKTWSELAKWQEKCITGHWFDVTSGKGSLKIVHKAFPKTWRCDAQTCREENSESFAGLHAANSSPFYIFDEASAIPNKIWEVAEGGLTDGEPFFFCFGNPTRNSGKFFECFHKNKHRWSTRKIDSREVQITNKKKIAQWVEDEGEDSDFVKVRVRGTFPNASSLQFIGQDLVQGAMNRPLGDQSIAGRTAVVSVDVARFGGDQSVIRTRIGRDARSFTPKKFRGLDTAQLTARVIEQAKLLKHAGYNVVIFVDGGGVGGGVADRLNLVGYDVIDVQFGAKADEPLKYANKRAEIWGRMKEWLKTGCLDDDDELIDDLTGTEYSYNDRNQILLESKEKMKKRGLASPDNGDALAIGFAQPVADFLGGDEHFEPPTETMNNYDPYKNI